MFYSILSTVDPEREFAQDHFEHTRKGGMYGPKHLKYRNYIFVKYIGKQRVSMFRNSENVYTCDFSFLDITPYYFLAVGCSVRCNTPNARLTFYMNYTFYT